MGEIFIGDKEVGSVKDFTIDWTKWLGPKNFTLDHTVFGKTSKTITMDLPMLPEKKLPIKRARPEQLGINLPAISWIGLNGCAGEGEHKAYHKFTPYRVLAHAHICPNDPDQGMICTREEWLFNLDGTYSDIVLHELAHIITDYQITGSKKCIDFDQHQYYKSKEILNNETNWAHGEPWKEWARKLGIDPSPYGKPPLTANPDYLTTIFR